MLRFTLFLLVILFLSGLGLADAAAPVTQIDSSSGTSLGNSSVGNASVGGATVSLTTDQMLSQQQNQIQYLQSQVASLASLQQSVLDLRGQNEVLSHQINVLESSIKLLTDRVVVLESVRPKTNAALTPAPTSTASASVSAALVSPAPNSGNANISEEAAYTKAYNLVNQNRYDNAIASFNQFLTQYPSSEHIPDVHYWLGELYMIKGQPDQATQDFRKVILVKDNLHVPDALRQLGVIYLASGDSAHAKQMFLRVIKEYPGTSAAVAAQKQLDSMS